MLKPFLNQDLIEAGCDEAGRGCLAGPVFAAAVILPADYQNPRLNDSKILYQTQREELRLEIERDALCFAVAMVDEKEIDQINILNASFLAMHRALEQLSIAPGHLLIDGNRFRTWRDIPHTCIVKGDGLYASIAAASILAKTSRDAYMLKLHEDYPDYGWDTNKGYPTPKHRKAIAHLGPSPHHRLSFRLVDAQMQIKFSCPSLLNNRN